MNSTNQIINGHQLLSLSDIFENNFFEIPDYQRGYSWELEQLADLREDIENLFSKDYKHFTGTIVAACKTNEKNKFDIVDGQQRITTLLILLHAIYNSNKKKYSEIIPTFFKRGAIGEEKYVLTPNEETRVFFTDLIYNNKKNDPKIKSHQNIKDAKEFMTAWVKEKKENAEIIYNTIKNKLGFIFFTPNDDKEIGIMFEVINNRGKRLSELEKIKNYFIFYSTIKGKNTLRESINDKWKQIQENLSFCGKTSNDDENSFLRYTFLVFYKPGKSESQQIYEQIKKYYNPLNTETARIDEQVAEMLSYVQFLADASTFYTYLYKPTAFIQKNQKTTNKKRIDKALYYLRCQPVLASIMPLYLSIMNNFNQLSDNIKGEEKIADLLELLEKVNFRLYLLPGVFSRSDAKQGDLYYYANTFFKNPLWKANETQPESTRFNPGKKHSGNVYDWLELELHEMVKKHCPVPRFVEVLTIDDDEDYDYYNWAGSGLRYFLARYEEKLKKQNKRTFDITRLLLKRVDVKKTQNDYLSIEHIWAKENRADAFPKDYKEKRRLGNFVLMGLSANIQQNCDDIPKKIKNLIYENGIGRGSLDMHQISELEQILNKTKQADKVKEWTQKTRDNYFRDISKILNDIRENILIRFALEIWGNPRR